MHAPRKMQTPMLIRAIEEPVFAWFSAITATVIGLFSDLDTMLATIPTATISLVSLFFFIRKKWQEDKHRRWLIDQKQKRIEAKEIPPEVWVDDVGE